MTGWSNPATDRSKPDEKGDLTDKNGIPISAVITPASTHNIKAVTDVVDNAVVQQAAAADNACRYCKKRQ
jgi:hypothetical protein